MNITIIQFSPSGNTAKATAQIAAELSAIEGASVRFVDITGNEDFFRTGNIRCFLEAEAGKHDLLLLGCPVYAHHLQYHMKDLISALPEPDGDAWGSLAIPYVTYGGISSGIALEEAAKLLRKSGRQVVAGMKISSSHRMTRAFLDREFNEGKPGGELKPAVEQLAQLVKELADGRSFPDIGRKLVYQSRITALVCNIVFNEKKWHKDRYPKVRIDVSKCSSCGKCVSACPVLHLEKEDGVVLENALRPCIHCLNCVAGCPVHAVKLEGNLEKGRMFMNRMITKKGNSEKPATALYR